MENYNKLKTFMGEYISLFDEVKQHEKNKMQALLSNDLKKIESAMQVYQTDIKKIELVEKQRRELFSSLGFGEKTFEEIANDFDGDDKYGLLKMRSQLQGIVRDIQYLNQKSMEIANIQLGYYNELAKDEETHMYNAKGKSEIAGANLLNTKA